jgi:2-haloacid dehalogenase
MTWLIAMNLKNSYPVVVFDAFGTLFDVYSVTARAETLCPGKGADISAIWRQKQVEYSWLRTMSNRYKPFWEITKDALVFALGRAGIDARTEIVFELMSQYQKLTAFAENKAVLLRLKQEGFRLGILTNGNREMIESVLVSSGFENIFEHVLTSDAVGKFKTSDEIYALAPECFGTKKEHILFVSSNAWDVAASTWYGFDSFWVNRSGVGFEVLDVAPTMQGSTLVDLQNALL